MTPVQEARKSHGHSSRLLNCGVLIGTALPANATVALARTSWPVSISSNINYSSHALKRRLPASLRKSFGLCSMLIAKVSQVSHGPVLANPRTSRRSCRLRRASIQRALFSQVITLLNASVIFRTPQQSKGLDLKHVLLPLRPAAICVGGRDTSSYKQSLRDLISEGNV